MGTETSLWAAFAVVVIVLLALDLGLFNRKPRDLSMRSALLLSAGYIAIALAFNVFVYMTKGPQSGTEFLTGYLIEKTLSLDNIFIIALLFTRFAVPPKFQHRILFWGVLGAIVMRGVMIFAGTALIQEFVWIIYVFGGFLIVTGIKMVMSGDEHPDPTQSWLARTVGRLVPITPTDESGRFWIRRNGVLMITPLCLVLILIEATDLVFALDSIPAIFAITTDPYIVFTSNIFAILGLRALYFALAGLMPRFRYLKYGLALVLVVVGTKMLLAHTYPIPTALTLALTAAIIGGSMLYSLIKTGAEPKRS